MIPNPNPIHEGYELGRVRSKLGGEGDRSGDYNDLCVCTWINWSCVSGNTKLIAPITRISKLIKEGREQVSSITDSDVAAGEFVWTLEEHSVVFYLDFLALGCDDDRRKEGSDE